VDRFIQRLYARKPVAEKLENFKAAVALHFAYYTFVRVHKSLHMTPAMAGGVTDTAWAVADLADTANA
jgi:hypothetical protein